MKKILVLLMSLVLVLSLISCGSNNNDNYAYNMNTDDAEVSVEFNGEPAMDFGGLEEAKNTSLTFSENDAVAGAAPQPEVVDQRKIIKSASMELETLEYELAIIKLQDKIKGIGGYIESSNVRGKSLDDKYSTRSAFFTIRVPEQHFLDFMTDMNTLGNIISENTYGEDITSAYFDSEAHVKTLEIQEERLLDILRKAEKIEDIIVLERELSNVRYQIESLSGNLRRWDNLISYATLSVSIYEVIEFTPEVHVPKTFSEKISTAFSDSVESVKEFFEDTTVFGLGSVPYLVIYIPLFLILWVIYKKIRKRLRRELITQTTEQNTNEKTNEKNV